ncbi:MAG: hypothetical protein ACKVX9_12565 [Blastocatellia bacterium]
MLVFAAASAHISSRAQSCTFASGSTGADGAFNPGASQTVQVPESGVFNFTTVTIPTGVVITFQRNSRNTPVTILATGNITINGHLYLIGSQPSATFMVGRGGPGGFDGGRGGFAINGETQGANGEGPGGGRGGNASTGSPGGGGFATAGGNGGTDTGGATYGSSALIPLIGGSGGGGGYATTNLNSVGTGGSGGGGSLLLATSGTISFQGLGRIYAYGGSANLVQNSVNCGGAGAGGAVRMVANAITGPTFAEVGGGGPVVGCGAGGAGYIRIEACNLTGFAPNFSPSTAVISVTTPKPAIPGNYPQLSITSVAGVSAPASPVGTFSGAPDLTFPTPPTNPVTVALAANNIPLTAVVNVKVTPELGTPATAQAGALAGTIASSTTTAAITLPTGLSLITASTTIDLTVAKNLAPIFINGERVRKMEISATFGGASDITYITESGRRVKRAAE